MFESPSFEFFILCKFSNDDLYFITKTYLYNLDPFKPHFYTLKLDIHYFIISAKNINCGYSLEPPRQGGSNGCPQSVLSRNMKISEFLSENSQFLVVKFSIYFNRRIFVTKVHSTNLSYRAVMDPT